MNIKYTREIKVGLLALVALFVLYYGFNFLKGTDIFHPVKKYHGTFVQVGGLTEQAPVYIRGFKVGQVDHIRYDFTRDSAFCVDISVNRDIVLPAGSAMELVSDGLLGGMAIQLVLPPFGPDSLVCCSGDYLPTRVVPGLVEFLQTGVLDQLTEAVAQVKEVVGKLNTQLDDEHLYNSLAHIDSITTNLTGTSRDVKFLVANRVPVVMDQLDSAICNIRIISDNIKDADLAATVARVDTAVDNINAVVRQINSEEGTFGKLLHDNSLYDNVNTTVRSADSLVLDLKANPKRYVHFSLFGPKKE
ncbi:MAG: MCE family protein [Paludibacteraceae bacterium]|nr:MCE family protein [Paludibacteraceae bacterium]